MWTAWLRRGLNSLSASAEYGVRRSIRRTWYRPERFLQKLQALAADVRGCP